MRAVRDGMIMSPPLTFSRADIDEAVRITAMALDKTAADYLKTIKAGFQGRPGKQGKLWLSICKNG